MLRVAVGTAAEAAEATLGYNLNGRRTSVTDGNGNRAKMRFDGHGRQVRWVFPSPTTPGQVNEADYEEYGHDPNGNRTSLRNRAGETTLFGYDALNRMTFRDRPGAEPDVSYGYDLRGLQTHARFGSASGPGIANAYDGFGQIASSVTDMDGTARTVASHYDLAGRRTAITGDAGYHAGFSYDGTSRLTAYAEGGTNTVVRLGYNGAGLRSSLSFGATPSSSNGYGHDGVGRLAGLTHDLAGTGADQARTFGYNGASQIVSRTGSNDAYAMDAPAGAAAYSVNGLNQYTAVGGVGHGYDANGNLTSDGSTTYVYDSENRLVSASGARNATLSYDPLGRLWQVSGANGTTRFLYDGDRLIQEYDGSGNVLRTYVHGTGTDEPLVWYDYVGGFSRRFLHADERGSIVAVADENGNALTINRYDEYGVPAAGNLGRFSYTGQTWIPELGLYYYKARFYSPTLGRFMQIDPIGYEGSINLYLYAYDDPVNLRDPSGNVPWVVIPAYLGVRCALRAGCRAGFVATVRAGVRLVAPRLAPRAVPHPTPPALTQDGSDPFETDNTGKVKDDDLNPDRVGDNELDEGIGQLERSISRRQIENDRRPRGNPNGSPEDQRNHRRYVGHRNRITREQQTLEQLRRRQERRDAPPRDRERR